MLLHRPSSIYQTHKLDVYAGGSKHRSSTPEASRKGVLLHQRSCQTPQKTACGADVGDTYTAEGSTTENPTSLAPLKKTGLTHLNSTLCLQTQTHTSDKPSDQSGTLAKPKEREVVGHAELYRHATYCWLGEDIYGTRPPGMSTLQSPHRPHTSTSIHPALQTKAPTPYKIAAILQYSAQIPSLAFSGPKMTSAPSPALYIMHPMFHSLRSTEKRAERLP